MEGGTDDEMKKTATTTTTTAVTPQEGETKSKRKMKTAAQLEILEKTYAVEAYPSEALRAELSVKLGLSDRQLQMWFCHRRLKDRKAPPAKRSRKNSPAGEAVMAQSPVRDDLVVGCEVRNEHVSGSASASGSGPFSHVVDSRRAVVPRSGVAMARIGADRPPMRRYYEPQQSIMELRAIAFVEAQLGEPLREDGPILGMEFDPLPPDAFGAPLGTVGQQKLIGRPYETKIYERPDAKMPKGTARTLHEYQFLPEQPTVRTDTYERGALPHYYSSPADGPSSMVTSLSGGRPFAHGNEQIPIGYGFHGQVPSLNLLPQQGKQGHLISSASGEYDSIPRKDSLANITLNAHVGAHSLSAMENPFMSSDRMVGHDDDASRMERKRKLPSQSEEARIAKEVEAHEKRIRKELEKQDIMRRKREEQMKKEMERHDRERRKEEERLLREKQREEERYQREQRRELERREKFLQKESIRAEKMRQKEELRREKEAARLKAANDRAIARRIAKESLELIEDERLELMELAASSKGLPSILSLDYETLQNLESFRDILSEFPPKAVQLKKPFAIQPWTSSEENVGNLLMVWRFLITFSDVLGLWPFTLDEFVQAFHDYDPRLLGEIHMALLSSIIKDIEDVARTPSTGLGTNQNGAANPGGGHPQIVEGAYAWGFNIRSWQHHLNPLTWPEILRQFALSAGFGPKIKKRNTEPTYLRDDNDGKDGGDIISNLRNGVAAENAVAIMQERGYSYPRRSRNRLTPGTVKFAAFHVLSLEGGKGLTILEVADKIQKSGLRDLTTSKTPEASIAAALSRDANLFERTAPSTYCVRPAYRKDPADADTILSAARERIRVFKSGFLDGEEADEVERDEDSESDVDPEVDDLGNGSNLKKEDQNSFEGVDIHAEANFRNGMQTPDVIIKNPLGDLGNISSGISSMHSEGQVKCANSAINQSIDVVDVCNQASTPDQEDTDIDESNSGEPWVLGLMEGEYSVLSVEERLNALVAVIGVAIEGNSIRVVLEERLEAATALKKQMWAEAQLDKRRMKEEFVMKVQLPLTLGNKTDPNLMVSTAEGKQSPMPDVDDKTNELPVNPAVMEERFGDSQNDNNYLNSLPSERNLQTQDISAGLDSLPLQHPGVVAERSRSQLKSYIGHKAEDIYVYRSLPLGQDRRRNRYWQFITSASRNDPGCGRIFVELREGCWRLIDSEEAFDTLLSSLDVRGIRESNLHSILQKVEISFKETVKRKFTHENIWSEYSVKIERSEVDPHPVCRVGIDSPRSSLCLLDSDSEPSSSFSIELGRNETEKNNAFKRYQDFQKWMWKDCLNSSTLCALKYGKRRSSDLLAICDHCQDSYLFGDTHCPSCHKPSADLNSSMNLSEHVAQFEQNLKLDLEWSMNGSDCSPLRIRLLKVLLASIEVFVPLEALQPAWTDDYRKSWGMKLHGASSAEDLLQILTLLESAIKRDYLSLNFETTEELLRSCKSFGVAAKESTSSKMVRVLPWIPLTTAAIALRLMELDASIFYVLHQKVESEKDNGAGNLIKLPSKYAIVKSFHEDEPGEALYETELLQENWVDPGSGYTSLSRGRGGRGRGRGRTHGGRPQTRVVGSRSGSGRRKNPTNSGSFGRIPGWKGRTRARGGRRRGRRTARSRQKPAKRVLHAVEKRDAPEENVCEKTPSSFERDEWIDEEITGMQMVGAENASSSERSEYDNDNGQATGDEYFGLALDDYTGVYNGKSDDLMLEASDDNVDNDEDDDEEGADDEDDDDEEGIDGFEDEPADIDIEGFINGYSDEDGNGDGDARGNGLPGEGSGSTSSDYSD